MLPFTQEQFLDVFARYHAGTWPAVWLLYLAAIAAVAWIGSGGRSTRGARAIFWFLAVCWMWMGAVYHFGYFAQINPAARLFALLFIIEAILLGYAAGRARITLVSAPKATRTVALILFVYALAIYPLLGAALGHAYPRGPIFGLPCPTTIFTLGVLLLAKDRRGRVPLYLFMVPLVWSAIGASAAVVLHVYEDWALPISAVVTSVWAWRENRRLQRDSG